MNVTETSSEGLSRTFEIVVPAKDLQARLDAKIEEIRPQVRLKGFRPGKVPSSHIKKVFGDSILGDVLEEMMPKAVQDTMEERGLELATQPKIEVKSDPAEVRKGGKDFEFEVSVEVMPAFEPADPAKMKVTRPVAEIADAQVEEALAELAAQNKSFKPKTAKTAKAEEGDLVVIDFVGKIDGEAFEGGSATDARVTAPWNPESSTTGSAPCPSRSNCARTSSSASCGAWALVRRRSPCRKSSRPSRRRELPPSPSSSTWAASTFSHHPERVRFADEQLTSNVRA